MSGGCSTHAAGCKYHTRQDSNATRGRIPHRFKYLGRTSGVYDAVLGISSSAHDPGYPTCDALFAPCFASTLQRPPRHPWAPLLHRPRLCQRNSRPQVSSRRRLQLPGRCPPRSSCHQVRAPFATNHRLPTCSGVLNSTPHCRGSDTLQMLFDHHPTRIFTRLTALTRHSRIPA